MIGRIDPPSSLTRIGLDELIAKARSEEVIIALNYSELVGCAFCTPTPRSLYIGKVAVAEPYRGWGIARRMFSVADDIARQHRLPYLELKTRIEMTENHRVFELIGFRKVAETAHPGYDRATSITMRRPVQVKARM